MSERMTYVPEFVATGHDPDCGAHHLEACDCASGIVRSISLAFALDLARLDDARKAARQSKGIQNV